jgi:hypothetical protein
MNNADRLRTLARQNLYFLSRGILGKGKDDKMTKKVHMPLCGFLQDMQKHRKLIVLPRSFLKSSLGCIMLVIWLIINNPDVRILITCYRIETAMQHLRTIRHIFENNKIFRFLFYDIIPEPKTTQWSDHVLTVKREGRFGEGTVTAAGVGTNIIGSHYDVIIMDDILTAKKDDMTGEELAPSQLDTERALGWAKLAVSLLDTPRLGYMYYIGTRWGTKDVIAYLLEQPEVWDTYIQNVYIDNDSSKGVIYPERFSEEDLELIKKEQGPYIYASQYLLNPLPIELMVFHPEWIQTYKKADDKGYRYTYVDPAISKSATACRTAIVTIEAMANKDIFVRETIVKKGMPVTELLDHIFRIARYWKPENIIIESVAYQEAIGQLIKERQREENFFFLIKDDKPSTKISKDERIRALTPRFANGQIFIKDTMHELRTEALEFQGVDNSRYVDTLDALAGAVRMAMYPEISEKEKVKLGYTMADILKELRERRGYRLPFAKQYRDMGVEEEFLN